MFSAADFREIVSGRRHDLAASFWRGLFWLVELPYSCAMRLRNGCFDREWFQVAKVDAPVISIGNITLGGTGKTPLVEWVARWFRREHLRVAVISRGYGAEAGGANDEARQLEQRLPDVPHLEDPDRFAAATLAIEELATQLILLDDAFQHRQLHRDLDIVLLDATDPFGCEHVFPRGLLREPLAGLARADAVILSRADLVDDSRREEIRRAIQSYVSPEAVFAEAVHRPKSLLAATGERHDIDTLAGKKVAAFCGLGNPEAFRRTLQGCGCEVVAWREFPDHHPYSRSDVAELAKWVAALDISAVVCTHKDLVKLEIEEIGNRPLRALSVELEFTRGDAEMENLLRGILARIPADDQSLPTE